MTMEGDSTQIVSGQSKGGVDLDIRKSSPIKAGKPQPAIGPRRKKHPKFLWLFVGTFFVSIAVFTAYRYWQFNPSSGDSSRVEGDTAIGASKPSLDSTEKAVSSDGLPSIAPGPKIKPVFATAIEQAEYAWRTGELVEAITIVKQLSREPNGGELATVRLRHYTRVVVDYEALSTQSFGPGYVSKMEAFYLGLDPLKDQFFWQYLERDLERLDTPETIAGARLFLLALRAQNPKAVPSSLNDILER